MSTIHVPSFLRRINSGLVALLFVGTQVVVPIAFSGTAHADGAAKLDQWGNITAAWVNGDLIASKATLREGDSVPYRMVLSGITTGSHSLTIKWDTTKGGLHALDYLTSFDKTYSPNPCMGLGCTTVSPSTIAIPHDTNVPFTQFPGIINLYGGTINSLSTSPIYTLNGTYSGDSSTSITIHFTTTAGQTEPVFAWGGHIASQIDWGYGHSASSISGSPYHTSLVELDGSGGSQDRALDAAAVFPTPPIATQVSHSTIYIGQSVNDVATVAAVSEGPTPTGTLAFSTCGPASTNPVCTTSNITALGAPVTLINGVATSPGLTPTALGNYCFFAAYVPDSTAPYSPQDETNQTTECVSVIPVPKGNLTLIKNVINNFGGTLSASSFTMHIMSNGTDVSGSPSAGSEAGSNFSLIPGTYTVSEGTLPSGYKQVSIICNGQATATVNVTNGSTNSCTITNTAIAPTLTLVKNVNNTHGGNKQASQWKLTAQNGTNSSVINQTGTQNTTTNQATTQTVAVTAGIAYNLGESGPTGYSASSWSCNGGSLSGSVVTLSVGTNVTCTITNSDNPAGLTAVKNVVNNYGGAAAATAFSLKVNTNLLTGAVSSNNSNTATYTYPNALSNTAYTVSEDSFTGYSKISQVCTDDTTHGTVTQPVVLSEGQHVTCALVNNDIAPKLIVKKYVINDNSGTSVASSFTMQVTASNPSSSSFAGDENGTTVTLKAGNYSVSEASHDGYTSTPSLDCKGTIDIGQTKTCTITNNDIPHPAIHVVKSGPATAHEGDKVTYTFTVKNTGDTNLSGLTVNDNIAGHGTYQSGDANHDGIMQTTETWIYTKQYTIPTPQVADVVNTVTVCGLDPIQAALEDRETNATCATDHHTLDVLHPAITVKKSGPLYGYEGQTIGYTFVVTNTGDTPLTSVYIDDNIANLEHCDKVTLAISESTNCTASFLIPTPQIDNVVNTVIAYGTDSLSKTVTATDHHTLDVLHPSIRVVKSGPATAHEGDKVTYTFTVKNTGDTNLSGLTVNDNIAGHGTYQSGDANHDGIMQTTETWIYTKQYTIPTPQVADVVNTVTVCGLDPIQAALEDRETNATCATDHHTLDVLHPAITVKKSGPSNAYQGDKVTYTFTVKNTGDTNLSGLTVNDNIAGHGTYQSGDANHDGIMQTTETWIYTADYTIPKTTNTTITNIVKTCGYDSLERNVCDHAEHSLHVYHPKVVVVKQVNPTKDKGKFNLLIDGNIYATNIGNNGTTGAIDVVTPGKHSVGEAAGTLTNLTDYTAFNSENCKQGSVTVSGDDTATCKITNTRLGSITIVKYAQPSSSQPFTFTGNFAGGATSNFTLIDSGSGSDNSKTFDHLNHGKFTFTELSAKGWDLTSIVCNNEEGVNIDDRNVVIGLFAGQNITCTFTNQAQSTVIVTKYNDYNLNGQYDPNGNPAEPALSGWDITVGNNKQTTGTDGTTTFTGLRSGSYNLNEVFKDGWTQSNIYCDNQQIEDDFIQPFNEVQDGYRLHIAPGSTIHCYIGNYRNVVLNLTKSVNRPAPLANLPGDTVTYTLLVTVPEDSGVSFNTIVTDLPPHNFKYVPGSWTAISSVSSHNVAGNIMAGSIIDGTPGNPSYGSPGLWHLGNLVPGEVITLTYRAVIGSNVSDGIYPDVAFVAGYDSPSQGALRILGNLSSAVTPFVGTKVSVITPLTSSSFRAQDLGTSILVNTGTKLSVAEFALPVILIGIAYIIRRQTSDTKGVK